MVAPDASKSTRTPIAIAVLIVATLAAYLDSFSGAFVFDDQSAILENASIRQLWPPTALLDSPVAAGVHGRPLANLSFALNYAAGGLDVRGYHVVNLLIHVLAVLALFGVIRRTLLLPALRERFGRDAPLLALAAAGLWGLHPVATNVVDYLSQRVEALMSLCYLATLYSFIRSTASASRWWPVATIGACGLGMASKEVMVTAPVVILLFDRTFVAGSFRAAWRQRWRIHVALAATWLVLGALMLKAQLAERGVGYALGVSPVDYALTECRSVLIYLRLAFWPHPLVFDYGWDFVGGVAAAAPWALALAALLAATALALRRRPALGFSGAWFFVILAPSSSVVPIIQQPTAENRLYLPLAAVTTLLAVGLYRAFGRRTLLVWPVIAAALGTATWHRNLDYRSDVALWADTIAKRPDNARAHNNLGGALLRDHRIPDAIVQFEAALRLMPAYPEAHNNLGAALIQAGRPADAIIPLTAAVRLKPDFPDAHYNLGQARFQTGALSAAIASFTRALELKPDQAMTHNNLGVALLAAGRVAEAIVHDQAAVQLDPAFATAHYNLGNALAQSGRPAEAMAQFETALHLDPDLVEAHNNLGSMLVNAGRIPEAIAHFEAALRVRPDYVQAQRNLAAARQRVNARP